MHNSALSGGSGTNRPSTSAASGPLRGAVMSVALLLLIPDVDFFLDWFMELIFAKNVLANPQAIHTQYQESLQKCKIEFGLKLISNTFKMLKTLNYTVKGYCGLGFPVDLSESTEVLSTKCTKVKVGHCTPCD